MAKKSGGVREKSPEVRPPADASPSPSDSSPPASPTPGSGAPACPAGPAGPISPVGHVWNFVVAALSSVKLGVLLLIITLVWVALGTFDGILETFDFAMIDWYVWWPFQLVLYLMCLNLTVVTYRWIPFNLPNLGVWVIHGSILLIAFGSIWFGHTWVDAVTRIDRGRTQTYCYSQSHREEVLHVWKTGTPADQAALRPHPDDGSGYSPNDLSAQYDLPEVLPQHRFRGGAALTEQLSQEFLPVPELTDRLAETLKADGVSEAAAAKVLALDPLRFAAAGDFRTEFAAALKSAVPAGELDDAARVGVIEAAVRARNGVSAVAEQVRRLKARVWFVSAAELRRELTDALGPLKVSDRQKALLDAVADDTFAVGPITTKDGLRLTITHLWPKVEFDRAFVEPAEGEPPADPNATIGVVARRNDGRQVRDDERTLFAGDSAAGRTVIRGEGEMLARLAELLRPVYDVAAREAGESEEKMRLAGQVTVFLHRVRQGTEDAAPWARRFDWQPAALSGARWEEASEYYKFDNRDRDETREKSLPVRAPLPVERVIVTDPRLPKPVAFLLEDWERTKTVSLDAAGLKGEKLVLNRVDRSSPQSRAMLRMASLMGTPPPPGTPVLMYRWEGPDGKLQAERVVVGGLALDAGKLPKDPSAPGGLERAFTDAFVLPSEKMMVHVVAYRTAVVQGFRVSDGPDAGVRRLVWSLEPFQVPYLAYQGRGDETVDIYQAFLGSRPETVIVGKSLTARPDRKVTAAPGLKDGLRVIRVRAEYDYTDDAGEKQTWRRDVWLPRNDFADIKRVEFPETVFHLDVPRLGPVELGWSGKRLPLGPAGNVQARLEHFAVETLPGTTEQHKEYTSYVTFTDTDTGEARTVKICMNEPKKADGYWFSQNSYDARRQAWTVLSVANKPAWSDPPLVPYAMVSLVAGVLWAFLVKPLMLKSRRDAQRAGG